MSLFKGPAYAEVLATIHEQCFVKPWTIQNFQEILNLPTTFGFGDQNGFVLCADLGDSFEILTLAILPNQRRKGFASSLLKELQTLANNQNKTHIFLEVNETNTPAIQLYLKSNFVQTGVRKNYYHEQGKSFDALCFTWKKP